MITLLAACKLHPDTISTTGLLLSISAGVLIGQGRFFLAGLVLLPAGLCDTIDGELARRTGRQRKRGAILDSVFDRLSELAVFSGIFWYLRQSATDAILVLAALSASFLVSYVRARAEGTGIQCRIGLFERPIRFLVTLLGVFFHRYLVLALWVVFFGAAVTFLQRLIYVLSRADFAE